MAARVTVKRFPPDDVLILSPPELHGFPEKEMNQSHSETHLTTCED